MGWTIAQVMVGAAIVIAGITGVPGVRGLVRRPDIAHTWKHGALVAAALIYAIVVPAVGMVIVLASFG